jgi:hypothetical protein
MAIVNRDGDVSEQKEWISWSSGSPNAVSGVTFPQGYLATGATLFIAGPMPYPYVIQSFNAIATGTSGAPQLVFSIQRSISGSAATVIAIGISNMVVPVAASFPASLSYSGLAATGSTLLLGQRGDIILATTAVANTAMNQLMINMVVKKTQDIVSYNGISG